MGCAVKRRIVLSGVNLVEAGPLAIFQDALGELAAHFGDRYEIIALVHRCALFNTPVVTFREFPKVKRSWLRRLLFEFRDAQRLSERLTPYLWLSMHDVTPRVTAEVQAVYCHNPAPFYRAPLHEALLDWTFTLFALFYRYLYQFRIGEESVRRGAAGLDPQCLPSAVREGLPDRGGTSFASSGCDPGFTPYRGGQRCASSIRRSLDRSRMWSRSWRQWRRWRHKVSVGLRSGLR